MRVIDAVMDADVELQTLLATEKDAVALVKRRAQYTFPVSGGVFSSPVSSSRPLTHWVVSLASLRVEGCKTTTRKAFMPPRMPHPHGARGLAWSR